MLAGCLPSSLSTYLPGSLQVGGLNHMMLSCREDARFPAQTADKRVPTRWKGKKKSTDYKHTIGSIFNLGTPLQSSRTKSSSV